MQRSCVNSYNSSIPDSSATSSHESSVSQLSSDIFHILLWLAVKIMGQNDYHSAATFSRPIARMTSQIRAHWLISRRGGLHCSESWQRLEDKIENISTFIKSSAL